MQRRRKTEAQTEILNVLKSSNTAVSHEMLQRELSSNIDRATIYRILNRFCEDGKVHKIVGDDGKQYFARCINCHGRKHEHTHHHFHFRCTVCGSVECLKNEVDVMLPEGYVSETFHGVIAGRCSNCD
ncbi:transcriptional repressor [uncultured Kriegella sp.]|uniref:Fur family transcriptional regulator n=1 Tax=uncultured Kriegella sp. TaxID=1798910 RepID=UPI0030DA84FC